MMTFPCRACLIYSRKCIDSDEFKTANSICSPAEIKAGAIKYFQGQANADTCKLLTANSKDHVTDTAFIAAFPNARCCNTNGCNLADAGGQIAVNAEGTFPSRIELVID